MQLIGITGFKRSGKDTLALGLCAELGIQQFSFADPIRNAVCEILGWTRAELEVRKEELIPWLGTTPRHMMQTMGTEWGRNQIHDQLWVLSMFQRMGTAGGVTSDVRFPNEAAAILDRGGVILRVHRPGCESDGHASEQVLPIEFVTHELYNEGSKADLIHQAMQVLHVGPYRHGPYN